MQVKTLHLFAVMVFFNNCGSYENIKEYVPEDLKTDNGGSAGTQDENTIPPSGDVVVKKDDGSIDQKNKCSLAYEIKSVTYSAKTVEPLPAQNPALKITDQNSFAFYNQLAFANSQANRLPINTAEAYQIKTSIAEGTPEEDYYKLVAVHHLLPKENGSRHHLFVEILGEDGKQLRDRNYFAAVKNANGQEDIITLDKPISEPMGNLPLFKNDNISIRILGADRGKPNSSDSAANINTHWPDEPLPNGEVLNSLFHHSFYLVFQKTKRPPAVEPRGVFTLLVDKPQGAKLNLNGPETSLSFVLSQDPTDSKIADNLNLGTYQLFINDIELKTKAPIVLNNVTPLAIVEVSSKLPPGCPN